jgi:hypothetical protein
MEKHTYARLTGLARGVACRGMTRRGDGRGAYDVHMNSPSKSGPKTRRSAASFCLLPFSFAMSPCLISFDRDRASRLRDAVTLGMSSL